MVLLKLGHNTENVVSLLRNISSLSKQLFIFYTPFPYTLYFDCNRDSRLYALSIFFMSIKIITITALVRGIRIVFENTHRKEMVIAFYRMSNLYESELNIVQTNSRNFGVLSLSFSLYRDIQ